MYSKEKQYLYKDIEVLKGTTYFRIVYVSRETVGIYRELFAMKFIKC